MAALGAERPAILWIAVLIGVAVVRARRGEDALRRLDGRTRSAMRQHSWSQRQLEQSAGPNTLRRTVAEKQRAGVPKPDEVGSSRLSAGRRSRIDAPQSASARADADGLRCSRMVMLGPLDTVQVFDHSSSRSR